MSCFFQKNSGINVHYTVNRVTFASRQRVQPYHLQDTKGIMDQNQYPAEDCPRRNSGGGSIIIHASSQLHMHDVVFHVIFGSDYESIFKMVSASAARIFSITRCTFLQGMMGKLSSSAAALTGRHGPDLLKALFFLFLNVDMVLKEYVCRPGCEKAFAAAMNVPLPSGAGNGCAQRKLKAISKEHSWSMMGTKPMDPAKGRRFFTVLHDSIIKLWMQDDRLHASDLVQMVKEEYLVS